MFLGAVGLLWWSQVAPPDMPPSELVVAGQRASSTVAWDSASPVTHIQADAEAEAARALGLAHGLRHAWTMVLWRQTARGRLARWLSEPAVSFDRHARQMGWARAAQRHITQLPRADRDWLAAYATGVNAALATEYVRQQPPFAALNVRPEPWAPWHTLAVEHLLTWVATDRPAVPDSALSTVRQSADSLHAVDDELRTWLGLHGWSDAMAWALRPNNSDASHIGYRLPRGSTTDALVAPVWYTTATDTAWIATVPGTRWTLAHHTQAADHVQLPRAEATWQLLSAPDTIRRATERLRQRDGHDRLVHTAFSERGRVVGTDADPFASLQLFPFHTNRRYLNRPPPSPFWVLTLPHEQAAPAQTRRFPDAASLPNHTPLALRRDTTFAATGATESVVNAQGDSMGVVLSPSPWREAWAGRLSDYTDAASSIHTWAVDDTSAWAQNAVAPLQDALDAYRPADSLAAAAAPFLRNWEGVFAPSSIGASIFQTWWHEMRALRASPARLDTSAYFASVRYRRGFERAVRRLHEQHGPDVRQWRWETVYPHRFRAPLWGDTARRPASVYPEAAHDTPTATLPGRGHISTLAPGSHPEAEPPVAGYHLHWTRAGALPPYYRTTDLSRTLADRLTSVLDAREGAALPPDEPSIQVRLMAP